jgi:hypothetical protein
MPDGLIGAIKLGCHLVISLGFERFCFVRLDSKKYLITFLKKIVLNDGGLPVTSCNFEPYGGYPVGLLKGGVNQ